jgi:Aspartyl/Asparaginyl beta-hydroxylase
MLKYLQLPYTFDVPLMQAEAAALDEQYWKLHYNTNNYEGGWTILPLRSMGGDLNATYAIHASASHIPYQDTELMQHCPGIASVLQRLQFPLMSVRLMKLEAGAIIKEHTDQELAFEDGEVRLHIPIFTNESVEFYVQGERVQMDTGTCWYLNLSLPHRVTNGGNTHRIHLVIDGIVNDWLRHEFAREDIPVKKEAEAVTPVYDEATRAMMVNELRRAGTEAARALAAKLEAGE